MGDRDSFWTEFERSVRAQQKNQGRIIERRVVVHTEHPPVRPPGAWAYDEGPNLVLWTGSAHQPGLMLKED